MIFNFLDYPAAYVPVTTVQEDEQVYKGKTSKKLHKAMNDLMEGSAGLKIGVQVVTLPYRDELCLNIAKQVSE